MRRERLYNLLETAERHTRAGRSRRAVLFYRKILSVAKNGESEWEFAQARLGQIHLMRGEIEIAIAHLSRAHQLDPSEHNYALWLGEALRISGRPKLASVLFLDACNSIRHQETAMLYLAKAAADQALRSTARKMVAWVAERCPQHRHLAETRIYASDA